MTAGVPSHSGTMRILAVTNMYPTPGNVALGTFVEQQVMGLRAAGVEMDVLFIDRRRHGSSAYLTVPSQIRRRLRRFDADLVHVMYGGVMSALAVRAVRDRPTIVTFHGSDLLGEHLSGWWRRLIAFGGVLCSRYTAHRATGVVVVAPLLSQALPDNVDPGKVRVIPCGIDLSRFRPLDRHACRQALGWQDDRFHVLFNSNGDDPVKRPGLARAAVERLRAAGIEAELQELRGMPNSEMPRRLNAGDVLLLTSRHEGSPTVVKEALACNVPVVSVDVGDVRQQIQGVDGCYLAEADAEDLAAKLRAVHEGPRRVDGRVKMEALSLEQIALRLREFYCDALSPDDSMGAGSGPPR